MFMLIHPSTTQKLGPSPQSKIYASQSHKGSNPSAQEPHKGSSFEEATSNDVVIDGLNQGNHGVDTHFQRCID